MKKFNPFLIISVCLTQLLSHVAFTSNIDNKTPDACSKYELEKAKGTLRVLHIDNMKTHSSNIVYEIITKDKCSYRLELKNRRQLKAIERFTSGSDIQVRGQFRNHVCNVSEDERDRPLEIQAARPSIPSSTNDRTVLVILTNFQKQNLACSPTQMNEMFSTNSDSVDEFYKAASYQQMGIKSTIVGPYPVTSTATPCDFNSWTKEALAAATSAGINPKNYSSRVYVFPNDGTCPWDGIGTLGGEPGEVWVAGCDWVSVFVHELGHNLTLAHAASPESEYGDGSDVMGYDYNVFNAAHKAKLGWIPNSKIQDVSSNGTFTLSAADLNPTKVSHPQVLRIFKPDTNDYYYLSFRAATAWPYPPLSDFTQGVNIHTFAGGSAKTVLLKVLSDGQSYIDSKNGLTFSQKSHDDVSVTLNVAGMTCRRNTPGISITPSNAYFRPGTTKNYRLSLTNLDSAACSSSNFNIRCNSPELSMDFQSSMNASAPTTETDLSIPVSVPPSVGSGAYSLPCSISNSNLSTPVTANILLTVDGNRPTAPTKLVAKLTPPRTVTLTWNPSTDDMSLEKYVILRNGAVSATTSVPKYKGTLPAHSTNILRVYAVDTAGNVSQEKSNSVKVVVK